MIEQPHIDTLLQHFGEDHKIEGAVTPPIFQNSLFVYDDYEQLMEQMLTNPGGPPYHYSRIGNPTTDVVEKKLAMLEKAEAAKVFGSGMAAISCAIMNCLETQSLTEPSKHKRGSHVVAVDSCYSVVRHMLDTYLPRLGITTTYVDGLCPEEVIDAIRPETGFIYLESPSTFVFRLQDLETICRAAKEKGVTTIMDNSYASPYFQNPHEFGVDMVVHSATKYLGGHSDIVAGVVTCSRERMENMLRNEVAIFGSILAPFPAWLLLRGLRTLHLRMRAHEAAGNAVCAYLEESPHVERVYHVGSPAFPQRDLFRKQMRGSGGLVSFEPKNQDKGYVLRFVHALELFQIGVSWGGFESLCVPLLIKPMRFTEERYVIRFYCGLEDPADMIRDIEEAFRSAGGTP